MPENTMKSSNPAETGLLSASDPKRFPQDLRMIHQAINNGWPVTPEIRQTVIERLVHEVESGETASAIKASSCILQADRMNQVDRHREAELSRSKPTSLTQININALDDVYGVIERLRSPAIEQLPKE